MSRSSLIAALCSIFVASSMAHASIQFSQADLLGMTVNLGLSSGYNAGNGTGILFRSPTGKYEDGVPFVPPAGTMSGVAGAIGNLFPGGTAYYSLDPADLVAFNGAISGGGETLTSVGYNDNNQSWNIGIWYRVGLAIFTDVVSLVPGQGGGLSLALPTSVDDAGVFVNSGLSQPDDYHASWAVPEASTIAVWSVLSLAGLGVAYKKRK